MSAFVGGICEENRPPNGTIFLVEREWSVMFFGYTETNKFYGNLITVKI